jgi:signal transduction histidine kinase/CheY-like chemotaxis protein
MLSEALLEFLDGRVFEEFSQPHRLAGVSVGRVYTFRDVTEALRDAKALRESEEQLRQSQRLEAVGMLSGGIAHDFNNLLTVILGFNALIIARLPEGDPLRLYADQIAGAGDRAVSLTRQLLAFSRRQALQPQVLNLNTVVSNMDKLLRRVIGEDIDLVAHMSPDLALVEADPGQMEQVIINLAVNARDAMPMGGTLTIETANVDSGTPGTEQGISDQGSHRVMLAITDTGDGMDAETLARIFEPFFTTKEQGKGTGLGLSTVYGIVKQSGGNIWAQSEPGRGTTFRIYLSALPATAKETSVATTAAPANAGNETILVVEDDGSVRAATTAMLKDLGYTVIEAASGVQAFDMMDRHGTMVDMLLTDMVLPGMGGREIAQQLQARYPALKVLFTSGFIPSTQIGQRSLPAEMSFLQKPFSSTDLAHKVREVLDQPSPV